MNKHNKTKSISFSPHFRATATAIVMPSCQPTSCSEMAQQAIAIDSERADIFFIIQSNQLDGRAVSYPLAIAGYQDNTDSNEYLTDFKVFFTQGNQPTSTGEMIMIKDAAL